jgi:hypothetical protein
VRAIIAKSKVPSAGYPALKLGQFHFNPIVTRKAFPKVSKHSLEHHWAL